MSYLFQSFKKENTDTKQKTKKIKETYSEIDS